MSRLCSTLVLVLLLTAAAANAQQNTPPPEPDQNTGISSLPNGGQLDAGFRATAFSDGSDEARYQRYRDLRNGPFGEEIRWRKSDDQAFWDVRATHVGYRDQQYAANYNRYGKMKLSFAYNQIPLFFSDVTRTAYTQTSDGVLDLGTLPAQVQSGAATSAIYQATATAFDLRLKRSVTDVRFSYSFTPALNVNASFKNTLKSGEQPWAGTFGFSDAVELAVPVDTRTTDIGVAGEWTGRVGEVRVGYDGSFFNNSISTLVWDNPLRFTDSPTAGPAQGRMALWPDSDLNSGSVSGVVKLPGRTQATGYVSLGNLTQDNALIPFTINSQLASPALDRQTADASARIVATAFGITSRPIPQIWLNARFRSYDFDNRTPVFHVTNTVTYDTTLSAFEHGSAPVFDFNRSLLDLEASWSPIAHAAFRANYSREKVEQTFRTFDTTTQNIVRLSADATGVSWLTLRAQYEHGKRTGSGLDEQSLDEIGEQTSLRQFDISDRDGDRFSAIVIAMPTASFSINGTGFVGRETRPNTEFGLLKNKTNGVAAGFDYVPSNTVSLGALYQYEQYSTLQRSRQANPGVQFDDPTRDWTTDANDRAHTLTASADLLKLVANTDFRFAYDFVNGRSTYIYGLVPNSTLTPVKQLPAVWNRRNRLTADARYMFSTHLGAGLGYWFEKYKIDDFAFDPATLNTVAQPSFISLQSLYRPYTANTFWARISYLW